MCETDDGDDDDSDDEDDDGITNVGNWSWEGKVPTKGFVRQLFHISSGGGSLKCAIVRWIMCMCNCAIVHCFWAQFQELFHTSASYV